MTLQIPKDILKRIPKLYATEKQKNPMVWIKFFTPWLNWQWLVIECDDSVDLCFGYVIGFENELGYFRLSELDDIKGPHELQIERDITFKPKRLNEIKRELNI